MRNANTICAIQLPKSQANLHMLFSHIESVSALFWRHLDQLGVAVPKLSPRHQAATVNEETRFTFSARVVRVADIRLAPLLVENAVRGGAAGASIVEMNFHALGP